MNHSKFGIASLIIGIYQITFALLLLLASLRIINIELGFVFLIPAFFLDMLIFPPSVDFIIPVILPIIGIAFGIAGLLMPNVKRSVAIWGIALNFLAPLIHLLGNYY